MLYFVYCPVVFFHENAISHQGVDTNRINKDNDEDQDANCENVLEDLFNGDNHCSYSALQLKPVKAVYYGAHNGQCQQQA